MFEFKHLKETLNNTLEHHTQLHKAHTADVERAKAKADKSLEIVTQIQNELAALEKFERQENAQD